MWRGGGVDMRFDMPSDEISTFSLAFDQCLFVTHVCGGEGVQGTGKHVSRIGGCYGWYVGLGSTGG